ncbi:hypothetical protein PBRA_000430 [Plasmodiophora brassicae]|uniref:Uncharacterized protein n=1 Tax=Plasmodiophora brassicae TaxID=37360 RepID=A0A0G4IHU2_PLABS|nr:hypothetical protein PBRA_000430 [Plasmodiophora brassicae]
MVGVVERKEPRKRKRSDDNADTAASSTNECAGKTQLRFFDVNEVVPRGVVAMAAEAPGRIAIARENGQIEICAVHQRIVSCLFVIPRLSKDSVITGLAWVGGRLFSCGLDAQIVEWDVNRRSPRSSSSSYGGAVFHMVYDGHSTIALACTDGSLRLFDVSKGSLVYTKALQAGALFIDPHNVAVSTADGIVRVHDVASGRVRSQMQSESGTHVTAMCVSVDGQSLVTGDTSGRTQFWSMDTFTVSRCLATHAADIRAVVVHAGLVHCTGIDHKIVSIDNDCTVVSEVRLHRSDVLCLASLNENAIVSAGMDAQICVQLAGEYSLSPPVFHVTADADASFVRVAARNNDDDSIDVFENGHRLARIETSRPLLTFAMAPDGSRIVTATTRSTHVLDILPNGTVRKAGTGLPPSSLVAFSSDSRSLVVVGLDGRLTLRHDGGEEDVAGQVPIANATRLCVSHGRIAVADADGAVNVFDLKDLSLVGTLPRFPSAITALQFQSPSIIAVALASLSFQLFDLDRASFTEWSVRNGAPVLRPDPNNRASLRLLRGGSSVSRIEFQPNDMSKAMLVASSFIAKVDLSVESPVTTAVPKSLTMHRAAVHHQNGSGVPDRVVRHSTAVSLLDFVGSPVALARFGDNGASVNIVATPWSLMRQRMQAPIHRHRYGAT